MDLPHVVSVVGSPYPVQIQASTIEALARITHSSHQDLKLHKHANAGKVVRVIRGPLTGIRGEMMEEADQCRLLIAVPVIGQALSVPIERADVAPIEWLSRVPVRQALNALCAFFSQVAASVSSTGERAGRAIVGLLGQRSEATHEVAKRQSCAGGHGLGGYGLAGGTVAAALLLTGYLEPLENRLTFFLLLLAVMISTWYGGVGSGVVALVGGALSSIYTFISPVHTFPVAGLPDVIRLIFFVGVSISTIILIHNRQTMFVTLTRRTRELEREVHERQTAEQLCRESEARYRRLFEKNPLPTCVFDVQTLSYLAVNQAATEHYGYSAKEFLTMTVLDIRPSEDVPRLLKALNDAGYMASPKHGVWRHRKRDGTLIHAEVTSHPITFEGRAARLVVYQDVSEHIRTEKLMQTLNKRLEEEVAAQTRRLHDKQAELRSIASQLAISEERERRRLAGLLHDNLSQLLVLSKLKLERMSVQQDAERAWNSLLDVKRLLDEALTYSRTLTADLRPPLLGDDDDLKAAINWVAEKMSAHGLRVHIRDYGPPRCLEEDVLIVTCQAVQELLWNVVKHAGVGEAFVSMEAMPECVEVAVHDHGRGFEVTEHPRPTKEGGFGLLNTRERLIGIGGQLEMTSLPARGTRAVIRLPVKGAPMAALSKSEAEGRYSFSLTRILLVDDHEVTRKGLRDAIDEQPDMTVVGEASTGPMALDLIRCAPPDIVIVDVHLRGSNGIDLTRSIKRQWPNLMVIGFSMDDSDRTVHSLREAGAADFISKAETVETLFNAIRANGAYRGR